MLSLKCVQINVIDLSYLVSFLVFHSDGRLNLAVPVCWTQQIRLSLKVPFPLLTLSLTCPEVQSNLLSVWWFSPGWKHLLFFIHPESSGTTLPTADRISLDLQTHLKFSVWVSFCEIYNENIHDLLEVMPSGASRRTVLRLSQDIMGRTFVKGTAVWYLGSIMWLKCCKRIHFKCGGEKTSSI